MRKQMFIASTIIAATTLIVFAGNPRAGEIEFREHPNLISSQKQRWKPLSSLVKTIPT